MSLLKIKNLRILIKINRIVYTLLCNIYYRLTQARIQEYFFLGGPVNIIPKMNTDNKVKFKLNTE